MHHRYLPLAALLAIALPRTRAEAQHPQSREGFWFNIGLGVGSLGCSDCGGEREIGPTGGLALGGTLSNQWLLGAFSNGWSKTEDGVTITAGTLVVGARLYPSPSSGFFIVGGVGIGRIDVDLGEFGSAGETGTGALLGLGWDIRLASTVSLTPFWNGAAIKVSDGDANFGQLGIGITIH
jgi:hypothetical protein